MCYSLCCIASKLVTVWHTVILKCNDATAPLCFECLAPAPIAAPTRLNCDFLECRYFELGEL